MRLDLLREINWRLHDLSAAGRAMEETTIPKLFGRGEAIDLASAISSDAATHAEEAVRLAQELQFAPEAIEQARAAIRALGEVRMNQDAVRAAGSSYRRIATDLTSARADAELALHNAQVDAYVAPRGIDFIVHNLARRDPASISAEDWYWASAALERHGTEKYEKFARLVYMVANGGRKIDNGVRKEFERVRTGSLDDQLYLRTAATLLEMHPTSLDRVSWSALSALLDDPRATRLLPNVPERAGSRSFADAVRTAAGWNNAADESLRAAFAEFQAASREQVQRAADHFGSHATTEQVHVAAQALGVGPGEVAGLEDIRRALELIARNAPDTSDMAPQAVVISRRTIELAKQNLARMDRRLLDGDGGFPDYGELGRIRENLDLLDRLRGVSPGSADSSSALLSW